MELNSSSTIIHASSDAFISSIGGAAGGGEDDGVRGISFGPGRASSGLLLASRSLRRCVEWRALIADTLRSSESSSIRRWRLGVLLVTGVLAGRLVVVEVVVLAVSHGSVLMASRDYGCLSGRVHALSGKVQVVELMLYDVTAGNVKLMMSCFAFVGTTDLTPACSTSQQDIGSCSCA